MGASQAGAQVQHKCMKTGTWLMCQRGCAQQHEGTDDNHTFLKGILIRSADAIPHKPTAPSPCQSQQHMTHQVNPVKHPPSVLKVSDSVQGYSSQHTHQRAHCHDPHAARAVHPHQHSHPPQQQRQQQMGCWRRGMGVQCWQRGKEGLMHWGWAGVGRLCVSSLCVKMVFVSGLSYSRDCDRCSV